VILFVPGIKGSELFEGENKRWFPSTQKDVELLHIRNDLDATSIIRQVTPFGIKKLSQVIYRGLLDEFGEEGLALFPYDWRQSVLNHVSDLADKIINESNASGEKVILIAHSMGGLLAKLAIQEICERGENSRIEKFITIGTPWQGAPDSFKALLYGEPGIFGNLKEILQFITVEDTRELARVLPSVYQLLPSKEYFDHEEGKFIIGKNGMDMTYDSFKTFINYLHDKDKEAKDFVDVWAKYIDPLHRAIARSLPDGLVHDCLIGHSIPTLYRVPEDSKIGVGKKRYKDSSSFKNGDGVVPIHSAVPPHEANLFFIKGEHAKLCSLPDVLEFIRWSINNSNIEELPDNIMYTADNSLPVDSNLKVGLLAKIMCPVESTILDEQGRYVAGVFDTSIDDVSDLADNENVKFFNIGESKYIYFADQKEQDLTFEIHAYKEGIASVSIEVFDEDNNKEFYFETIPVSNERSAKLIIPADKPVEESSLEYQGETITPFEKPAIEVKILKETPIPKVKILYQPTQGVKKVKHRPTYSGPVILNIESDKIENIAELFYSIDGKSIQKYAEGVVLTLSTGQHTIEVFGKDIYNRPITPVQSKISIDNQPPKTRVNLTIEPDGVFVSFEAQSNNSPLETKYRFIEDETVEDQVEWKSTDNDNKINVPSSFLRLSPNNKIKIEFYSINKELEKEESINALIFHLGDIPILMWEETAKAVTPIMIFETIFQHELFDLNEFSVNQLIQNKYSDIDYNAMIADNVKSIRFESDNLTVEVLFSEKYSLFFSGSPTELLKLGQEYDFSFELKTERSNESISSTSPKARLHPIKAPKLPDTLITLSEQKGVFKGKFTVDSNFKYYKHKLIITDIKNISPPLREITLLLDEEDKEEDN
jgi:pimeloyl-ACP methyl ester carboxylesterase